MNASIRTSVLAIRCFKILLSIALLHPALGFSGSLPPIQTVFVIVMENHSWSEIKGSPSAPFINNTLLPASSFCEAYYSLPGPLHPSLPNYLWLEAGTNFGIFDNNNPDVYHQNSTNHFVTLLKNAGISWKGYMESISGLTVPLFDESAYAVRHNPFAYFDDVTGTNDPHSAYALTHIRPFSELAANLTNNQVARYNFIVPDQCSDGHDACYPLYNPTGQIDAWLAAVVPAIQSSQAYKSGGALFITFDECGPADPRLAMIVLSPLAKGGGYSNSITYNHSSALRTFQEIFGVGPLLGDAANAANMSDLFLPFGFSSITPVTDGMRLTTIGVTPGKTNSIQASTNLVNWESISTNVSTTNTFFVIDSSATNLPQRFYRLVQLP